MRYAILVVLSVPIVFLALMNIVTQYKTKKIQLARFRYQLIVWAVIFVVLVGSFPVYNIIKHKPILDSSELSLFDIVQTTTLVYVIYVMNDYRRRIEQGERAIRDLNQQLSIKLSGKNGSR